jgi:hypothetical protein
MQYATLRNAINKAKPRYGIRGPLNAEVLSPRHLQRSERYTIMRILNLKDTNEGSIIRQGTGYCSRSDNAPCPRFITFHNSYLNKRVEFELQNTFLEKQTEDQLYKLFTHVSLTRDPRAARDMVSELWWANLPPDTEIIKLQQQRAKLEGGSYQIQGQANEAEIR